METWSAVALAFALSVDGLAVGVAYGMRRIHVPGRSLLIIGLCSAMCFFVAMTLGQWIAGVVGLRTPRLMGAAILVGLGLWNIGKSWLDRRDEEIAASSGDVRDDVYNPGDGRDEVIARTASAPEAAAVDFSTLLRIHIRGLGIVVQVLREPGRADMDRSGAIDAGEAFVLGAALGLDALAAGFGAALIGFRLSAVAVVAAAQLLLTWLGLRLGRDYGARWLGKRGFYVPGVILILIGLLQL